MRIADRVAVVTGASSGIGRATALAVAGKGGRVALLARRQAALEEVAAEIAAGGGTAWCYPVDLTDAAAVAGVAQAIQADVGTPDVVVNNAGSGRWWAVEETEPAEVVATMAMPYFGAFYVTRAFLPGMLRRGSGHIVNLTSPAAYTALPGAAAYAVARWAMRGFTQVLRVELHGTGIGVTLVVPGLVSSEYFENNPGTLERLPGMGRLYQVTPEQVARAIVRGVEAGRGQVVVPFALRLTLGLHRFFPGLIEWPVIRTGWRRPPVDEG
ncbi:MAG: SDR family NAD(P)-dependent oxidoreductase [Chloroflexi bacterium]|nr:SDR family NAD(P)-dependent oxidoreductase [Chloroflexota bacterium]MCI0644098.1 SDR family NAD(P)-dependent oxidoreductase [Chloroflexota bacterium]